MPARAEVSFLAPLLGERLRRFAGVHLGAALSGAGVGLGLVFGLSDAEDALAADALPLVAAGLLIGLWVARRSVEIEDRKERHLALHSVLPGSRRVLAAFQVIEPVLVMLAGSLAGVALWWVVWRFGGTETLPPLDASRPAPRADLVLILGFALWTTAVELFQVGWNEVRARWWGQTAGKVLVVGVPLALGMAVGWGLGILADDGGLRRELFQALFATPLSFGLAALVITLSVALACRLFVRRNSYLGC